MRNLAVKESSLLAQGRITWLSMNSDPHSVSCSLLCLSQYTLLIFNFSCSSLLND